MLGHLPLALAARDAAPVAYRFEIARDDRGRPLLELGAVLPGDADGETELGPSPGWGGTDTAVCDLRLVAVCEVGGSELQPIELAPGRWTLRHAPGARLAVDAVLEGTPHQDDASPRVHDRPILDERVLHLIGELCLLLPVGLHEVLERPVRLEAWTDASTLADVRAGAVDGAPFEWPPDTFAPVLELASAGPAGVQRARLVDGDLARCRVRR